LNPKTPAAGLVPELAVEESANELYEQAPCGYLTTTVDGRIVRVNRTLADWLGYEPAELTGRKRFVDLLTVGGKIFYETHFSPLLHVKAAVDEIALDVVCKDGRVLPMLINGRQKRDAAGVPLVNRFTIFNASERRMYERELLAARDLLRTTLASIGDGVVTTDAAGRVSFMNRVAEALSGWTTDAAQGKLIEEVLVLICETDGATVENPITQAIRDGVIVGLASQTLLLSRDGRRIPIEDSASPIQDGGDIVGGVLVFRDISERLAREHLERAGEKQRWEMARLASLGRMAGGIAHDFNNLLTTILGNADLLVESAGSESAALVSQIRSAGERAAGLTNQMLAYSGRAWLDITELDLDAHIRANLAVLKAALPVNVSIALELGLPPTHAVRADAAQILQVIMNLLINASEAVSGDAGVVTIRTELAEHKPARFSPHTHAPIPPGMYAVLEIRDNGSGMSEDVLKSIFDPFFTTKFTGRGLGLSAVTGIIKAHSGDIEVESAPGLGSVFRIFLPAAQRQLDSSMNSDRLQI
jgi:two-component system cell cycle sensor histidine kinase/response regulator CckA